MLQDIQNIVGFSVKKMTSVALTGSEIWPFLEKKSISALNRSKKNFDFFYFLLKTLCAKGSKQQLGQ